jgi:hypothetical protein
MMANSTDGYPTCPDYGGKLTCQARSPVTIQWQLIAGTPG